MKDVVEKEDLDYKLLIDTAALAGTVMLENGAEIYRVEETINYILRVSGLKTTQSFVVSTGFMISLDDPDIDALTVVRRVDKSTTNLNMIAKVNDISRKFYKGEITLYEAFYQIKHLQKNIYPWWIKDICTVFVVLFFTGMFGGSWKDMFYTGIVGLVLAGWFHVGKIMGLNGLIQDLVSAGIISVMASLFLRLDSQLHLNLIIVGAIMLLVPGAAITNAIRDTLHGDYAAGNAKILESFVKAAMIALGVYIGLLITGGVVK